MTCWTWAVFRQRSMPMTLWSTWLPLTILTHSRKGSPRTAGSRTQATPETVMAVTVLGTLNALQAARAAGHRASGCDEQC